jgi:hypothetical protein
MSKGIALFVYVQPGCGACAKAKTELLAFRTSFPNIMSTELNVAARDWRIAGIKAKATPMYIIKIGPEVAFTHTGTLTAAQLTKIVTQIMES